MLEGSRWGSSVFYGCDYYPIYILIKQNGAQLNFILALWTQSIKCIQAVHNMIKIPSYNAFGI